MASWQEFAIQAPELAAFGGQRLGGGKVDYLATKWQPKSERKQETRLIF